MIAAPMTASSAICDSESVFNRLGNPKNESANGATGIIEQLPRQSAKFRIVPDQKGGLIHQSDRGGQYLSIRYTERLAEAGIEPSVGSVGDSYDCERDIAA
jgi:transposase InsO family protein